MNIKIFSTLFFICKIGIAQVVDQVQPSIGTNFSKINDETVVNKFALTNIETSMKLMEDNILKLMRELGELKMQINELKINIKNEFGNNPAPVEPAKNTYDIHEEEKQDDINLVNTISASDTASTD